MKLRRTALDLFFPPCCLGCGREGDFICPACRESLSPLSSSVCPRCGRPQAGGALCPDCTGPSRLDGLRAPFVFQGVIRQAIHELKYRNLRALAAPLAGMLNDHLAVQPVPGDVLVPVPLHRRRLRERGYNQSALLARELGRLTGRPLVDGCLIRQRYTPPQARTTSAGERQAHVAGAFACRDGRLRGRRVILIDDVATSGATLDACAAALKAAGAAAVWGLVVARDI
jgi:ComF family protein